MDEDELVHGLVNSLAFEVEAIPEDNFIKFTSTIGTPLNVKVRVRNKDEPRLVQRGIVSVPKLGKHIASLDQIKLISSDQTILSFNVYMETELRKQSPPKNRKRGLNLFKLGGCLGTSYDEDEEPYLPGPSSKKALRSRTSSKSDSDIHAENMNVARKQKLSLETSYATTRNEKKLFGKCKPGGCLDPPYGEDKEPYRPESAQSHMKPKLAIKVEDNEEGQSLSICSVGPRKSSKEPTKLLKKEPNHDEIEPKSLLDIYARPLLLERSSTSNYSNVATRNSSKMSSSKMLEAGKNISRNYDDDSLIHSYQYPETYFVPPKDILQHKEEEIRYSRERSNDQIRPATARRENERQTSGSPHIFDVPSKKYPENADARNSMKLSKHKGKDNTERIKQTLTDLTSNEVSNAPKSSEDYRKDSKPPLNKALVTQKIEIISDNLKPPSHDAIYPKNIDYFEIPIAQDDLDLSIIFQSDLNGSKFTELNENVPPANNESIENKLEEKPLSDKLNVLENKKLFKDTGNKHILKNEEPIKSAFNAEAINTTEPESSKNADMYFIPNLVNGQDEGKILRSVPSSNTQKWPQVDYPPFDLNSTLGDKPTSTSDNIKKATDSQLPSNKPKDQTKPSMDVRLPSMDNITGVDDTNEKNNTTSETHLENNLNNENGDVNIYLDTAKYVDTAQKSPSPEISQEQTKKKLDNGKQINRDCNLLVNEVDDGKINESLQKNETLMKQIKETKNVQEEQIPDLQTTNKFKTDEIQKSFNDFKVIEDSTRKTLQNVNSKNINDENLYNIVGIETFDEATEEKSKDLNSNCELNNDWNAKEMKTDSITNQKILQNAAPSERLHKNVLNEQYREMKQNYDIDMILSGTAEPGVAETFIHDLNKNNKNKTNAPDFKGASLNNNCENLSSATAKRPEDIAKVAHDDLSKFDKQLQNKNAESNISDSDGTNKEINTEKAFNLDDKKQPVTASIVDNSHLKHQPNDTSIKNLESNLVRNLSHESILKTDNEFVASVTNSKDSLNSLKTRNLNYEENKNAPANVNLTDNDNVIIKNISVHDQSKHNRDRIPSAILQKTPLVGTVDSDFRNDEINVIKPFKRNTFTIVASGTSLEKQDEPISTHQTDHVTDEHLNAGKDKKLAPNDRTITDSERFAPNDQQKNNGFIFDSKEETISTDPFVNISIHSETNLEIHDRSIENYTAEENKSELPGLENKPLPGNQNSGNTEDTLVAKYDDKVGTMDYDKSSLPSNIGLNDVKIADSGIRKSQEENDNEMYSKEKLTLKNIPLYLAKQNSELQDKSVNDFENIDIGPNLKVVPHYNEKLVNDVINDKLSNTTIDNKTIQITNSAWLNHTEELPTKKISISNIPVNIERAEKFLTAQFARDANDIAHVETLPVTSDDRPSKNSALVAMEYGSKLLEMAEEKLHNEQGDLKNTFGDILQSTVAGESNEHTFELFSGEKPIDIKDINPPMVNEDGSIRKISDTGSVGSLNKVIYKESLSPEDSTRHYDENETNTIIDEDGNLRKISNSDAVRSLNKIIDKHSLVPKDDIRYSSEFDGGTRITEYGGLRKLSESHSVESFNKNTDRIPIKSKDSTGYYTEYDSSSRIYENGDLRNTSKLGSVGPFNEVEDKEPLLVKDDITRDIEQDFEDGALRKISDLDAVGSLKGDYDKNPPMQDLDAVGSFRKENDKNPHMQVLDAVGSFREDNDRKPPKQKDYRRYYGEYAPSSKAPISTDKLGSINQSETKINLDTITNSNKQPREHSDSVIWKQQDRTRIETYNQNENMPNRADREGTISSPVQKAKSEVLSLNLALQSYTNDNNEKVVQTFNPLEEPERYKDDNITVVQSLIRHGQEIRIPVDIENDLSLKFMSKTQKVLQDISADQNSSKKMWITTNISEHARHRMEDVDESLAFIYERELIPLHNIIRSLTEEINTLTTQQELLKDKLRGAKRTKSLRLIPVSKRCGCRRM